MLKDLVKVANRLDSLGFSKEADFLDSIIRKIAAMNTGTPPYMNAGTGDFELEMGEEDACRKLHSAINNWYLAVEKTLNFKQNKDIFNFIPKINNIKGILVRQYISSRLKTPKDVLISINNLLEKIQKHNQDNSLPASDSQLAWWFTPEDLHYTSSYFYPKLHQFDSLYYSGKSWKVRRYLMSMVEDLRMGSKRINDVLDALKDLSTENAYTEIDKIREIIDPAMELTSSLKEISDSLSEKVFQAARDLSSVEDTSPTQDISEESQIPMEDADAVNSYDDDELYHHYINNYYMNLDDHDHDDDDDYHDDDDHDDDRKKIKWDLDEFGY